MERKTVIFCGTPEFACPSLERLHASDAFHISLVLTQPDRPVGRKHICTPPPVKSLAERLGLFVYQPENPSKELLGFLEKKGIPRPDFLVVVAYGHILRKHLLDLPIIAPVNVHASLLPRWRGASPIEHAIMAGDSATGITVQIMVEALDAGPILAERSIAIAPKDTAPLLRERLSSLGAELLCHTLSHSLQPHEQPLEGVSVCKKLRKEDGYADPTTMSAQHIDRLVRALNPWPGVLCPVHGKAIKIRNATLSPSGTSLPLPCAEGTTLYLETVQEPGRKPLPAQQWLRGSRP